MGDPLSYLEGVDIPAGLSQYDFTCQSDCSLLTLDEPITVFQEGFHMHMSGVSAVTYHIRNGEIIRQGQIDFYDFNQAGLPTIRQEPFTVMPGDSFVSKFWFNSKNGTKFGKSSYEEMNRAVFLYYPAKLILSVAPWFCTYDAPIGACNSSLAFRSLTSVDQTERKFGLIPSQCSGNATPTVSKSPTTSPTKEPTKAPTKAPTKSPTKGPTKTPTKSPSKSPTKEPTKTPTKSPTESTSMGCASFGMLTSMVTALLTFLVPITL